MSLIRKIKNRTKWLLSYPVYWFYKIIFKVPEIKSIEETIEKTIATNASISRYGDGELDIIVGRDIPFQKYDERLANKMKEILKLEDDAFLVCLPDALRGTEHLNEKARDYWKRNFRNNLEFWARLVKKNKVYYNASMTRPYIDFQDKANSKLLFDKLKYIWNNRDIVFVEGEKSRLGVGNDLFVNAKSINRILCPAKDAFTCYDEIISFVSENISKQTLILIALGPTATAMAHDLYKMGYQAIDIGHVDIEYEWFRMGATKKVAINNKYTNEAIDKSGEEVAEINDKKYLSEILVKVGC